MSILGINATSTSSVSSGNTEILSSFIAPVNNEILQTLVSTRIIETTAQSIVTHVTETIFPSSTSIQSSSLSSLLTESTRPDLIQDTTNLIVQQTRENIIPDSSSSFLETLQTVTPTFSERTLSRYITAPTSIVDTTLFRIYEEQSDDSTIAIGILVPLVIVVCLVAAVVCYQKYWKKRNYKKRRKERVKVSFSDNPVVSGAAIKSPRYSDSEESSKNVFEEVPDNQDGFVTIDLSENQQDLETSNGGINIVQRNSNAEVGSNNVVNQSLERICENEELLIEEDKDDEKEHESDDTARTVSTSDNIHSEPLDKSNVKDTEMNGQLNHASKTDERIEMDTDGEAASVVTESEETTKL